jgi:hypothetical protein
MTEEELDEIERRALGAGLRASCEEPCAEATGPGPWETFIESEGPLGGGNLIWIGGEDEEHPDLYLWRGEQFCSDEDFRFIGAARQDIPQLVEAIRRS